MSDSSSQNKTEQPTSKRLRDAKKKGDVWHSADLPATVSTLISLILFSIGGKALLDRLSAFIVMTTSADFKTLENTAVLGQWTYALALECVMISAIFVVILLGVAILTGFFQVGAIFSLDPVMPQLSRLNPVEGTKRLFSMRNLFELVKLVLKSVALTIVVFFIARSMLPTLLRAHWLPVENLMPLANHSIQLMCWAGVLVFAALTAFDVWFQRQNYIKRHMMSKEEVMRESREMEGNPHIRQRRRQMHHEANMAGMMDNVRKANVVVVNPTHIAVALFYEKGETDLPVVVAKGEGFVAQSIRDIAEQEGIPIMQNVKLARGLHDNVPLNQYIPDEFIEPVAIVLRWVRDMQKNGRS